MLRRPWLTRAGLDLLRGGDCAVTSRSFRTFCRAGIVGADGGGGLQHSAGALAELQTDLLAAVAQALGCLNEGRAWTSLCLCGMSYPVEMENK